MSAPREQTRFWQAEAVAGVELLHARYVEQRFAPHVHEGFVFTMIEQGAQRFRHRGSDHLAPVGTMVLINPDEVHTGSKAHEDGWRYRAFYPDIAAVTAVLGELGIAQCGLPSFSSSTLQDLEVYAAFRTLHHLLEGGATALQQQSAWRETILLLFQRHARIAAPKAAGHEPRAVTRAKELLVERLGEPPSLETLAAAVNLSPFHFLRVFRRATGLPPHAWLRQRRLDQARALLKAGCPSVDVAMRLGYADQSHLTRQFKQAYGVGPGAYGRACKG
ncbi:AraC family ligand binding domain-containing protein [Pseudomonas sp. LRF_L74]|uniref:AraC family transcriptional regulator n=1 Tax=Pseudomonas sp. LRF_L74 TaxID=3369422 RepID=UPI003F605FCB